MSEILVSTGALIGRPNGRDYRLLKEFSKKLTCDGYELMMYSDWYDKTEELVDFICTNEINAVTFHCQKSIGEAISKGGEENLADAFRRFEINASVAGRIGARKIVMHLWDGVTSDQNIENNLKAYKTVREIADENGVDLLVENVVCNRQDPLTHWNELLALYPDIHFVWDTKMAAFHNQDEELYKDANKLLWQDGHICHYHVNDYGGGYMDWANLKVLPIGRGRVDFEKFIGFVNSIGYKDTFTLESTAFSDEGIVDFDMLNDEIAYLRERLAK